MLQRTIGSILLESGRITAEQAQKISDLQNSENLRFGDAAIKLGFISAADVKFAVSQQFDYSYLSADDTSIDQCLISAFVTEGPQVEAFKNLRSQLTINWLEENKSIIVCSPVRGCGSSYVAANLAVLYAQAGKKTLLVDANFRHPSQHLCFRQKNQYGLSQVLANRFELDVIEKIQGLKNLQVLFTGAIPPNPMELLERNNFLKLEKTLEELFDIVIYDAPPVNNYSDTYLMASVVKGVLIVAHKNETKISDLKLAKQKIESANAVMVGAVMSDFKKKKK